MIVARCCRHCGCVLRTATLSRPYWTIGYAFVIGSHSSRPDSSGRARLTGGSLPGLSSQQYVANSGGDSVRHQSQKTFHQNKTTRSKSLGPFRGLMRQSHCQACLLIVSICCHFTRLCRQSVSTPNGRLMIAQSAVFSKLRRLQQSRNKPARQAVEPAGRPGWLVVLVCGQRKL